MPSCFLAPFYVLQLQFSLGSGRLGALQRHLRLNRPPAPGTLLRPPVRAQHDQSDRTERTLALRGVPRQVFRNSALRQPPLQQNTLPVPLGLRFVVSGEQPRCAGFAGGFGFRLSDVAVLLPVFHVLREGLLVPHPPLPAAGGGVFLHVRFGAENREEALQGGLQSPYALFVQEQEEGGVPRGRIALLLVGFVGEVLRASGVRALVLQVLRRCEADACVVLKEVVWVFLTGRCGFKVVVL